MTKVIDPVRAAQANHAAVADPVARQPIFQMSPAGEGRKQQHGRLGAAIPEEPERREDQDGQARRVDGIDLSVATALDHVRRQLLVVVGGVVAGPVVVFDAEVAVLEEALRNHEVVHLVALRNARAETPPAGNPDRESQGRGHAPGSRLIRRGSRFEGLRRAPGDLVEQRGE